MVLCGIGLPDLAKPMDMKRMVASVVRCCVGSADFVMGSNGMRGPTLRNKAHQSNCQQHEPSHSNLVYGLFTNVHIVRVLDEDNLIHVPMSLRARTSVLDLWVAVEKYPKSVLNRMIG